MCCFACWRSTPLASHRHKMSENEAKERRLPPLVLFSVCIVSHLFSLLGVWAP